MNDTVVIALLSALLGSGVMGFFQFLINRKDDKDGRLKTLETALKRSELAVTRLQLLVLISLFPTNTPEILTVAATYFDSLGGDWYMESIFGTWLAENSVPKPSWFSDN